MARKRSDTLLWPIARSGTQRPDGGFDMQPPVRHLLLALDPWAGSCGQPFKVNSQNLDTVSRALGSTMAARADSRRWVCVGVMPHDVEFEQVGHLAPRSIEEDLRSCGRHRDVACNAHIGLFWWLRTACRKWVVSESRTAGGAASDTRVGVAPATLLGRQGSVIARAHVPQCPDCMVLWDWWQEKSPGEWGLTLTRVDKLWGELKARR